MNIDLLEMVTVFIVALLYKIHPNVSSGCGIIGWEIKRTLFLKKLLQEIIRLVSLHRLGLDFLYPHDLLSVVYETLDGPLSLIII
jgi:hypothetical protein